MRQIPLAIADAPMPSFDNFVVGANALALAQLQAWRAEPSADAPVYLWSPPGTGKTHLLHALAGAARRRGGRVSWFAAGDALPWTFDESAGLIVLDDCDALDASRQQAAFTLFVEAATHGVALAAAGRVPPVDLGLRDDLRSRLGWGHVIGIAPLGEADTRAALRREADRRAVFLSDEVMDYLLTRFSRNLKDLMRQLDRLDAFSLATHRSITVPLLKRMLAEEGGEASWPVQARLALAELPAADSTGLTREGSA